MRAPAVLLGLAAFLAQSPLAAQGIGLIQLHGGVAIPNSNYTGTATWGARGALGFRTGHFGFGLEAGAFGLGGDWSLRTAGGFVRVGQRTATGLYGIGGFGYQGPARDGGLRQGLFGASAGVGWSAGGSPIRGLSAEARYQFSVQNTGAPTFGALLLTVGWEWRW